MNWIELNNQVIIKDEFGRSGKAEELIKYYKLDAESIIKMFK